MVSSVSWIPKGAAKVMLDAAEPPSNEKIRELIKNGTLKERYILPVPSGLSFF